MYYSRAQAKYLLTNTVVGHGGDNRRICIQPQSRRSSHYCMTMIKRPLSRFFQFQGSQHSFQDCMDYILPGLHRKHSTTPSPRQHHCSLHPPPLWFFPIYHLSANLQVFCRFNIFWQIYWNRVLDFYFIISISIYYISADSIGPWYVQYTK